MSDLANSLRQLKTIVDRQGVRAALIYLNGLTEHRFSAMYLFDKETLVNLYFYDRENPSQWSTPDIPVLASYCVFVRDSRDTFVIHDALQDNRVHEHPKQKTVQAYCGVPLLDENGNMFGTICHFNLEPIPLSPANIELMEAVAPMLKQGQSLTAAS